MNGARNTMHSIAANQVSKYAAVILVASGLALSAVASTTPQTQTQMATPVTVTISPVRIVPGEPVTISGTTAIDARNSDVKIAVTPPQGSTVPAPFVAEADSNGNFSAQFSATTVLGIYQVQAQSPGGNGSGAADFAVMSPEELAQKALSRTFAVANQTAALIQEAASTATAIIEEMPDSPPQQALIPQMNQLNQTLTQAPQMIQQIQQASQQLQNFVESHPENYTSFQPALTALDNWSDTVEQKDAQIQSEIEASKSLGAKCDKWDEASKMLAFTADMIGFIWPGATPKTVGTVAGSGLAHGGAQDLVSLSATLTGVAAKASAWAGAVYSAINDISQHFVGEDFSQYCVKFEGPFKARMHGEVAKVSSDMLNEQNWWKFETIVSGTLTLRYPKPNQTNDGIGNAEGGWFSKIMGSMTGKPQTANTGEAVHLSGEFEGNATNFQVWENAMPVLAPKFYTLPAAIWFHKAITPLVLPPLPGSGRVTMAAAPKYFKIPVEGAVVGNQLSFKVVPPGRDFDAKATVVYVTFTVLTAFLPVPIVTGFTLPYPGASVVLSRSLSDATAEFTITNDGSRQMISGYKINTKTGGVNTDMGPMSTLGFYEMKIKACNPGCSDGVLSALGAALPPAQPGWPIALGLTALAGLILVAAPSLLGIGEDAGGAEAAPEAAALGPGLPAAASSSPLFNPSGCNTNCGLCSDAIDNWLADRGLTPAPPGRPAWPNNGTGPWVFNTSPAAISNSLLSAGDGARGIVYVWDTGVAHVFNAVNQGGNIVAIDGQINGFGTIGGVAQNAGYTGSNIVWGWRPTFP
jgi:hypothetical protein